MAVLTFPFGKGENRSSSAFKRGNAVVALAGNPNVGKSTLFNALTGLHQHTGNWPGKTVGVAVGEFCEGGKGYSLVDLPGTYSLFSHSKEEAVARDFLCFERYDAVVAVCDCTTPKRSLSFALQVLEVTRNVVICLNLAGEAKKKNIRLDPKALEDLLGVPVVLTDAKTGEGLSLLRSRLAALCGEKKPYKPPFSYDTAIETALSAISGIDGERARFIKARLLFGDKSFLKACEENGLSFQKLGEDLDAAKTLLAKRYLTSAALQDSMTLSLLSSSRRAAKVCVEQKNRNDEFDRRLDRVFTGAKSGIPVMLLLLTLVLFITVYAANYPSQLLSRILFSFVDWLKAAMQKAGLQWWLVQPLTDGAFKTTAWVVSVMLPPMAIFFPLFTLLEDFGYLPRVAFNLDHCFKKCNACGKQSLCMCMGLGCNAVGVEGCRIIDSKRERLIAVLTNSFMPCNGRFPTMIAVISLFFFQSLGGFSKSLASAAALAAVIAVGAAATFSASRLLSKTVLRGESSAFTLELPPYRAPKVGEVLVRSVLDRTLYVLSRAVCVSAPMGLLIWLLANVKIADVTLIARLSSFLDVPGRALGLDGVILLSFFLGFPANEIVLPIALMCYTAQGTLVSAADTASVFAVLSSNGWTAKTGLCFILFSLMHFPCSTTVLTVFKETGSAKWTALSCFLPMLYGVAACVAVNLLFG